jgi:hypothetical protein
LNRNENHPYRYAPAKPRPRLLIPNHKNPVDYIRSFDSMNYLKSGVAFTIGGVRYDGH